LDENGRAFFVALHEWPRLYGLAVPVLMSWATEYQLLHSSTTIPRLIVIESFDM
jgi:hypothetical protein